MVDSGGSEANKGPLTGITVLELGSFIAGPFAGQILGDYGANVIKVEPPKTGDPMRKWGVTRDGDSLWWPTIARNKSSICVDMHDQRGLDVIRTIASRCDIVIENFRPGRLAEWGLTYENLSKDNPRIIMVHVSGFGQTGPKSFAAGFGSIGEAVGGIRYTTGDSHLPPSRTGISLGDSLAALFSVIGSLAALSDVSKTGRGQEVDVAIYEAVAALMESTLADLELGNVQRERTGSVLPGVSPSNAYPAKDNTDVIIAGNADSVFRRLTQVMGQPELANDPKYASHADRGRNMIELDKLVAEWTRQYNSDDLLKLLEEGGVPAGKVYAAKDMIEDVHFIARDMVLRRESYQGWDVPMNGVVPKFSKSPGTVRSTGPRLGADTRSVLCDFAGISETDYAELLAAGVIGDDGATGPTPK